MAPIRAASWRLVPWCHVGLVMAKSLNLPHERGDEYRLPSLLLPVLRRPSLRLTVENRRIASGDQRRARCARVAGWRCAWIARARTVVMGSFRRHHPSGDPQTETGFVHDGDR